MCQFIDGYTKGGRYPLQMGHRDPRMTLRVYTDVTGMKPRTSHSGLLGDENWFPLGTGAQTTGSQGTRHPQTTSLKTARMQAHAETGATGLEPATSGVTGRRSNQLSYAPRELRRARWGAARRQS